MNPLNRLSCAAAAFVLSLPVIAAAPAAATPTAPEPNPAGQASPASLPGSLVYIKSHNIWLARGDGSGQYQVTRDGTSARPYRSPSQSDTGIIAAGHGNRLVRMTQNGTVLSSMDPPPLMSSAGHPLDGPPLDVAISPNGKLIAWTFAAYQCPVGTSCGLRAASAITAADRLIPASTHGTTYLAAPSWIGNARTLQTGGYLHQINLTDLGRAPMHWFDDHEVARDGTDLADAELSPDGAWLAAVRGYGTGTHIAWYAVRGNARSGPAPVPPVWICATDELQGLADPTWSPDSRTMAWQEPDGIWIKTNPAECSNPQPQLHIRGGSQPDWSAAAVRPAPRKLTVIKRPSVSGKARVGTRLRAKVGTWSPKPTSYSYRWLRNGKTITRATSSTYRLAKADRGKRVSVRVTAKRSAHTSKSSTSKPIRKVSR